MRPVPILAALAFALTLPIHALDISGNVLDKLENPIAGAKVCIKSDPTSCVTTDADGAFDLTKAIAIRNPGMGASAFSLTYRRGSLIVRSPSAVAARLEWLGTDGRRAFSASEVKLAAGANALPLPAGLPHAGVVILRLTTADQTLTWKAVLAPGIASPAGGASSASPRIAALAKAAAATLEISKTGYRTRTYEPAAETETDVYIYLSETSDVGVVLTGNLVQKIIAIDHVKKTIVTEFVDVYCDTGSSTTILRDTTQDTSSYAIRDGNLWTWATGDCTGPMFTGTASDIVGTWTLVDPNALLPADLRTGCTSDTSGGDSPFESLTAVYTISATQASEAVTAETCAGDYFGYYFADAFSTDSTVIMTKNTCKEIILKNGKGETATVDFSNQGDSLHSVYSYKTSTCALSMDFGLSQKDPVCPEGAGLAEFMDCAKGTGFANVDPLAKAGSLAKMSLLAQSTAGIPSRFPMSLERRAPPVMAKLPKTGWLAPLRDPGHGGEYISRIWKALPQKK
jgi:hypothetical protein